MPGSSKVNVLLVGGGGREHALAEAIARSPRLGDLHVTHAENPGLAALGRRVDAPASTRELYRLQQYCDRHSIGLVVIGPEDPLADGWADRLAAPGRRVFGPGAAGARLESDKAWTKQFLRAASVPTAESRAFASAEAAIAYVQSREDPPVIKASGLAKGKGVVVPTTIEEAVDAVRRIMVERVFGDAGQRIVVEERLHGPEVSVFALVDGRTIYILETCQDHKRLGEGDTGPNTGGMGAFSPSSLLDDDMMLRIQREVLVPTLDALRREEIDYRGVLYAGLMLTHAGPKLLEYNVRFGDPECQALMPRLRSDALELLLATCEGRLHEVDVEWDTGASCCVVLASRGYPEKPESGRLISGLDRAAAMEGVHVYHAGTRLDDTGRVVTAGGRVLGVTAVGETVARARERAYAACDLIEFDGKVLRRDIGARVAQPA